MKIPSVSGGEYANSICDIVERTHVNGNVSEKELELIAGIVFKISPHAIFEFGTFDGRTTANMALNAPADCRIYTLDLPASAAMSTRYPLTSNGKNSDLTYILKTESGKRYKNYPWSEKIIQLCGDSGTFDYAPYADSIDLVFIDGSHSKEYVQNDTEAAFSMVRKGGMILWHDYGKWPGVTAYLENAFERDQRFKDVRNIEGTTIVVARK